MKHLYLIREFFLLLLTVSLLSSCGFALRGSSTMNASFDELVLNLEQPNSEFARLLQRSLDVAGIATRLGSSSADLAVLSINAERIANRAVTVNPQARAAQYEIRLSVDIALAQNERTLISEETLMVERIYFEDIANLAGTRDEVQLLTSEMRRDLIDQVLRRLEASSIES